MFPIGVGDRYDEAQLRILAGPGASSNVVKLQQVEDLPTLVTLGNSFFHKLCSGKSYIFSSSQITTATMTTTKPESK